MNPTIILSPKLYFSYSQFMVYDQCVRLPGCAWTDKHTAQGFARRESSVCFNTPLEFGLADVSVFLAAYQKQKNYDRVIAVPFLVQSGKVIVDGPEELDVDRTIALRLGNYRLTVAQCLLAEDKEAVDVFFEAVECPLARSEILLADEALDPPTPLIETADVAG